MPSDSPASSGRQSPQTASSDATCSDSKNEAENKTETPPEEKVDESSVRDTENSENKDHLEKLSNLPNNSITRVGADDNNDKSNSGDATVDSSPTITVKLTKLTKDNKESELVSEILGGLEKYLDVLEKELPKTPKSDGKSSVLKGDSNINPKKLEFSESSIETTNLTSSRRPKRLVRKVVEEKDKKDRVKDKQNNGTNACPYSKS